MQDHLNARAISVNVSISDVGEPGLYAYELKLYYDNTILEAIASELPEGHFLTQKTQPIYSPR
jgi:hypothetical protein